MNKILLTILSAAISGILLGPIIIPVLKVLKFGQTVRTDGPKTHFKKSGTPTMGGIIIVISLVLAAFIVDHDFNSTFAVAIAVTLGNGFIGFLDDGIKIIKKRSLGLRAYQKLIGQFIFAFILSYYAYKNTGSKLYIPFTGSMLDLGVYYIPVITLMTVFTTNCVNLTDGLDGLASTVTMIVCLFFTFVCYGLNMDELAVFSGAVSGACIGFLRYNSHPAQVIMGDTGSLALGGAVSSLFVLTGFALYLPIVGAIFAAEGLSVMIQVVCFKLTGRRIFKMAPLHHHFELMEWHETKVVTAFCITAVILCLIGLLALQGIFI